jgi:hypothetical protein
MSNNEYIQLVNNIYNNIDVILENDKMKIFIINSENIINKYLKLFPSLTYHQVISIYISMTYFICTEKF